MSVGSMEPVGMKKAWNRKVLIRTARIRAMMNRPGSSLRNWMTGLRCLAGSAFFGRSSSGASGGDVFTGQGYLLVRDRGPSERLHSHLDGLERRPDRVALAQAQALDRAGRDLGDERRPAVHAYASTRAVDHDLGHATLDHVARRSLRRPQVQRDVDGVEQPDHVAGPGPRPRHEDVAIDRP